MLIETVGFCQGLKAQFFANDSGIQSVMQT